MALLVALPQLLLGSGPTGLVALCAVMAALFTFSEYSARAPSLIEFRDAGPYNRIRVGALLAAVLLSCTMLRTDWAGMPVAAMLRRLGDSWASLLVPWSPVHLLVRTLPADTDPALVSAIRAAAAAAYGVSLLMIVAFALAVRLRDWPGHNGFNVWVNLPQFDPTAGADVVEQLQRDAQVNLALGLLLPLIAPLVADVLSAPFDGIALREPAALIWLVMAWAFIPASLAMRGLALNRLAWLIAAHRARLRLAKRVAQAAA